MKMSEYNSMLTTKKDHHFLKIQKAPTDPTNIDRFQMIQRKCIGCGMHFKTLASSKQKYHSADCQTVSSGVNPNAWRRLADTLK